MPYFETENLPTIYPSVRENDRTKISDSPEKIYLEPIKFGPQSDYGSNRWVVFSPKLKRNVTLYSDLEYDHWALVEFDNDIELFCEQPLKIKIKLPGGTVTSIFDMWIKRRSGVEEFREVKFENALKGNRSNTRISRQIAAQRKWCELHQKQYSIITEKEIRSNPLYLSNVKMILRHLNREGHENRNLSSENIAEIFDREKRSSIKKLKIHLPNEELSEITSVVFEMIHNGRLKADLLNELFDLNTVLEATDV